MEVPCPGSCHGSNFLTQQSQRSTVGAEDRRNTGMLFPTGPQHITYTPIWFLALATLTLTFASTIKLVLPLPSNFLNLSGPWEFPFL